jgi:hypothetical protein
MARALFALIFGFALLKWSASRFIEGAVLLTNNCDISVSIASCSAQTELQFFLSGFC